MNCLTSRWESPKKVHSDAPQSRLKLESHPFFPLAHAADFDCNRISPQPPPLPFARGGLARCDIYEVVLPKALFVKFLRGSKQPFSTPKWAKSDVKSQNRYLSPMAAKAKGLLLWPLPQASCIESNRCPKGRGRRRRNENQTILTVDKRKRGQKWG